jgi:hypothetical protein
MTPRPTPTLREALERLHDSSKALCMWVRHTVPTWTPEVDKYLDQTEARIESARSALAATEEVEPVRVCSRCGDETCGGLHPELLAPQPPEPATEEQPERIE